MTRRKIIIILFVMLGLLMTGSVGYMLIEKWSFLDALYMTVITMTTIGFKEVAPLSAPGRIFTIIFSLTDFVVLAGVIGTLGSAILEGRLLGVYRRKQMGRKIDKLKGHVIICGAGTIGSHVMREMYDSGRAFVLIENDTVRIEALLKEWEKSNRHFLYVQGDATREAVLNLAGLKRARGMVACLAQDADNLFISLTARKLSPKIRIASKVQDEENIQKFFLVGVNEVVSGDFLIARKLAMTVMDENLTAFLDQVTPVQGRETFYLSDITIPENSHLVGKTLGDAGIPQETGLLVIAVRKIDQDEFAFNPNSNTRLDAGDVLIFMGSEENQQKLRRYLA